MLPRQTAPTPPRRRMFVAFALAGRRWVLPAEEVAAVGELRTVTRLPTDDPCRLGILVHRGRAVALVAVAGGGTGRLDGHYVLFRDPDLAIPVDELIGLEVEHGDRLPEGFERFELPDEPWPAEAPERSAAAAGGAP